MDQETQEAMLALLDKELIVALGCTDVSAIAYAAALARTAAAGPAASADTARPDAERPQISAITVRASGNIIKNAMGVGIPGTAFKGLAHAAALGAIAGDPSKALTALECVAPCDLERAEAMVDAGLVSAEMAQGEGQLFIEATVETKAGRGVAAIRDDYDRVAYVRAEGFVRDATSQKLARGAEANEAAPQASPIAIPAAARTFSPSLADILEFVRAVPAGRLGLIAKAIELNSAISAEGLSGDYGLKLGKTLKKQAAAGLLADDLATKAMSAAAAGVDARMAGSPFPVVANTGSGNQGITATMPVVAAGICLHASDEKILRAATLSHLVAIHIKSGFGLLSGLCGAMVAGTGASAGIAWLLSDSREAVERAIQNMIGSLTGMACDGAKASCALKVSTATSAAVQSALLAAEGLSVSGVEGIVDADPERSIGNLARLAREGSPAMDALILGIMIDKAKG